MNKNQVSKVSWYSVVLMALTSIHHVYGAIIYHTQWRLHVLLVSIPVIAVTILLSRALQRGASAAFIFRTFFVVTLAPSFGFIGLYEGIYNHILKNILFFGEADTDMLMMLFPLPMYEMPNDAVFEITGILQGVIAVPLAVHLARLGISLFQPKPVA